MYKITVAYDESPIHWTQQIADELEAHKEFAKYVDWGFADEYATVILYISFPFIYAFTFCYCYCITDHRQGGKC